MKSQHLIDTDYEQPHSTEYLKCDRMYAECSIETKKKKKQKKTVSQ